AGSIPTNCGGEGMNTAVSAGCGSGLRRLAHDSDYGAVREQEQRSNYLSQIPLPSNSDHLNACSDGWPASTYEGDRALFSEMRREPMNEQAQIRVFSVDDHPLVNEGVAALMNIQPDMQLVAQA